MFCTESCEHCINATSTGRILNLRKSSAQLQQESAQMAQQQQQQQQQQQRQEQQYLQPNPLIFPAHQPCCNMSYGCMPQAEMWLQNCDSEPQRVGMCFVTEGPEGLSIDCNVPIPNSFDLDEYKSQMLSFVAASGNSDAQQCCMPQQQILTLPQSLAQPQAQPKPRSESPAAVSHDEVHHKPDKLPKLERSSLAQAQTVSTECPGYHTAYTPYSNLGSQGNPAPPLTVLPDSQLLAYLSGLVAPMHTTATTSGTLPYQHVQTVPSCCLIELQSFVPLQQPQHQPQSQQFQPQWQQQQQLQQQQQQQLLQPTFTPHIQPFLRFPLPCMLTGIKASQPSSEQCGAQSQFQSQLPSQPPIALHVLSLPAAISVPCIPQPTAASTLSASDGPSEATPKPSKILKPTEPVKPARQPTLPKKPILANKIRNPRYNQE